MRSVHAALGEELSRQQRPSTAKEKEIELFFKKKSMISILLSFQRTVFLPSLRAQLSSTGLNGSEVFGPSSFHKK